jgi:hypothetical protein
MVVADVCSLREQKEIGAWCLLQAEKGYEALAMAVLTRFQGWSKEEVADLIEKTMVETRDLNIHPLHNLYVSSVKTLFRKALSHQYDVGTLYMAGSRNEQKSI